MPPACRNDGAPGDPHSGNDLLNLTSIPHRRWRGWLLASVVWVAMALLFATQNYATLRGQGQYIPWSTLFYRELPVWIVWGLISPAIDALTRRFPLGGSEGYSNLLIHIPAGITFAFIHILIIVAIALLTRTDLQRGRSFMEIVGTTFTGSFVITIAIYAFIVTAYHAIDYYRAYQGRELAASQLEASLARARLDLLRMQIHPHFLFNTLHGISALMAKDVPAARKMMTRLSDLLRLSLEGEGKQEIEMAGELLLLEKYVEIQRMRFADRLTVELDVDARALGVQVPRLLLQPLVENAIGHGIERHAGPGRITISARCEGKSLRIVVRDNGPGLRGESPRERVGLGNTRERLARLYGAEQSFTIEDDPGGGAAVTVMIPLQREEESI
jgi:two-component system LytT family sensor kinase